MMLGWEQEFAGELLHAYEGSDSHSVCGKAIRKHAVEDGRVVYSGPSPTPPSLVCEACKAHEREHHPMYLEGIRAERARTVAWLRGDYKYNRNAQGFAEGIERGEQERPNGPPKGIED